ncbi:hypothetical protein SteCoe_34287 [Stentor coeruleus]|uniref:VWFA domain-containing protein n=1 Tax=Stentor coeruleus TaxID=5963 RepID=A0A1R2AUU7_9CILI|nr:hypothetical protein SteCoe_34287 [Stentor coeruleus]
MDSNRIYPEDDKLLDKRIPLAPETNNSSRTITSAPVLISLPTAPLNFPPQAIQNPPNLSNTSTKPPTSGLPNPLNQNPMVQQLKKYQNIIIQNPNADTIVYSKDLILDTDEPLSILPEKVITDSYENLLSFSIKPLYDKLKLINPIELPCTVTLKGGKADLELIEKNRQGLDLIFVVDISGSMRSGKIDLVKITMEFVITLLKDFDRVSVIGFNDSAFIYCPLTVMNEQGKVKMNQIINSLGPGGGTNIECGVRAALHILADRKVCNQVTSILLLSDGCDNNTNSVNYRIEMAIKEFEPKIKGLYRMHTFGYGKNHDSVVMNLMADLTNGNFYYVENESSVADAFANCMGELVALLASNIQISLTTKACEVPFRLSKVFSNTGDTVFTMPNVFFSDKKDSVFVLEFEAVQENLVGQKIIPVEAVATFTLKNGEKTRKTAVLELLIVGNDEEVKSNENVLLEYYRVKGAESLNQVMELADAGKFADAINVAKISEEKISKSEVANNPKIQALIKDIRDSQIRAESKNSWNSGGRAQVTSIQKSHFNKVAKGNCIAYQNTVQSAYSVNSNVYMNSKTVPTKYSQPVPIAKNYASPGMIQQPFISSPPQIIPDFVPLVSGPQKSKRSQATPVMKSNQKVSKSSLNSVPESQKKMKIQIPGNQVPHKKNMNKK